MYKRTKKILFRGLFKDASSTTGYTASNIGTSATDYLRSMQKVLWTRFRILSHHLPERTGGNHENCADS
jgi:hypothetical protein